jgi:murein DD-endopeptidase MepM/ murein hydrolase activator NlpD
MRLTVAVLLLTMLAAAPAARAGVPTDEYTPLTVAVAGPLIPFTGTDGRRHLVYELHLTNASRAAATLLSVDVRDGGREARRVGVVAGAEVEQRMTLVGTGAPTAVLEPGQTAIFWLHLPFAEKADVPQSLVHRLAVSEAASPGGGEPRPWTITAGRAVVSGRAPIVIGPPLEGGGWVAGNGCCDGTGHRRAALPLNGRLYLSQRTAIDWLRIDDQNRAIAGEPGKNESDLAYGQKVIAVKDARVVSVLDGLPDRVPGKLPTDTTVQNITGNHVILDLGGGLFAFYAHLKPGSVRVREGERVRRGQALGLTGNSGNTTGAHLHFHVMNTPSALAAEGMPYVIDAFALQGRVRSLDNLVDVGQAGGGVEVDRLPRPEPRRNELPLDLDVIAFPPAR